MVDTPCRKLFFLNSKAITKVKFIRGTEIMETKWKKVPKATLKKMEVEPIYNKTVLSGGILKPRKNNNNIGNQVSVISEIHNAKKKPTHSMNTRDVRHTPTKHKFETMFTMDDDSE